MVGVDQRAHPRFDVDHEIEIVRGDATVLGRMRNLSRSGTLAIVPIEPHLKVGDRVSLSFQVPDLERPIACQAEVRWVNDVDRSVAGLHFTSGLRAREAWALGKFLDRLRDQAAS
jgi:hypothetical protein